MRLYLSGPMTGLPGFNRAAFHEAAATLRAQGYTVANPAALHGDDGDPWEVWMRRALGLLLACDAVAFLPGWLASRGARLEHTVAEALGMPRYLYVDGELRRFI
ncbi:MAG: DUF4406 domain-containing protein [Alicyclobacillus sp.]|nr:DUF4406 domain-containing protein [Alicyclobacillus sp.]